MSRISAVRSTTLTLTLSSRFLSWDGASSPSQMTVSAPVGWTISRSAVDLAAADERRRVGLLPALVDRVEHLRAGGLGEQRELGHGVLGVLDGALGPHADEHDALEPELAVLDLGDVLELGRQAGRRGAGRAARRGPSSPVVSSASSAVRLVGVAGLVERPRIVPARR